MHHLFVRHIAIGEDHLIDRLGAADVLERAFILDGDAIGIEFAGQRRRITPPGDAGDLRGGEGDHPHRGIIAIDHIEIVEIAPGGAEDQDAARPRDPTVRRSRFGSGQSH